MTILERFRIDDRVAIVTGACSGLGVAFAQALPEAGADVVLGAREQQRGDFAEVVGEVIAGGLDLRASCDRCCHLAPSCGQGVDYVFDDEPI